MKFANLSPADVEKLAKPIWDNIITAGNDKNYQAFAKDFSITMKKNATREGIEQQWQQEPMLSSLAAEPSFIGILRDNKGIRVLWKQKFKGNDEEALGHLELVIENDEIKVDGAQIF